jgi:tetratricopeptide (TPR) repeat protein
MKNQSPINRLRALANNVVNTYEEFSGLVDTWTDVELLKELAQEFFPHSRVSARLLKRLRELEPKDAQIAADLGFVYWALEDPEDAELLARTAFELDPRNVQGLLLKATLARDEEERRKLYREILEIDPKNRIARTQLQQDE